MSQELPPSERPPEPPTPRRRSWEEEKEREKEQEKEAEKSEKPLYYGEKFRRDPLSGVIWALILIWAGLVLAADNMDLLPPIGQAEQWNWILFGAGLLVVLEVLLRAVMPDYARPATGRLIWAAVLILIGLSGAVSFDLTWPLILVLFGLAILIGTITRR